MRPDAIGIGDETPQAAPETVARLTEQIEPEMARLREMLERAAA